MMSTKQLSHSNTRNTAYPLNSINVDTDYWELTYETITQDPRFQQLLLNASVDHSVHSPTPAFVRGEETVKARVGDHVLKRVRWALKASQVGSPSYISIDVADRGCLYPSEYNPDLVGFFYNSPDSEPVPRVVGDVKCSWKFEAQWKDEEWSIARNEFHAVAAQVNYYMNVANTRYGYVLTDKELVLFRKRVGAPANELQMTKGIPLQEHDVQHNFTPTEGKVTVLLALWYMHLLALSDDWMVVGEDIEEDDEV